jgi:hypothetical protein
MQSFNKIRKLSKEGVYLNTKAVCYFETLLTSGKITAPIYLLGDYLFLRNAGNHQQDPWGSLPIRTQSEFSEQRKSQTSL